MDALFVGIKAILDGLIPSANLSQFENMNNVLAYVLTIGFIYLVLLKPIFKLAGIIKK